MKDQGLIHEVTTSVSYIDKILWVATYFGASRYDGRYWHNFLSKDSGLPSNFLNQIKAVDANRAYSCVGKGVRRGAIRIERRSQTANPALRSRPMPG